LALSAKKKDINTDDIFLCITRVRLFSSLV